MRYGILSDIHGNLEALQAVVKLIREEDAGIFLCLGDIVGYGADPRECLEIVRDLEAVCIAGNHDWAVSGRLNTVNFNDVAKEAIDWTRQQLSEEDIGHLNDLGLIFKNDDLILVHGTLGEPERFLYMVHMSEAVETFYLMDRDVCFVGHSHAPQIIIQQGEKTWCLDDLKTSVVPGNKYIINAGSVGQPRDGDPRAAYCIFDTDAHIIEIKRTLYDVETAQKKILRAGLPVSLAERLSVGH